MALVTSTSLKLQEPPAAGRGYPIGAGDWRLVIERLVGTGSLWGASKWGTAKWGGGGWEDLSDEFRGMSWRRGSDEPVGRPRAGQITIDIGNVADVLSPWENYPSTRPGTIMRAGLISATDTRADGWIPLWTGTVEDWPVTYIAARSSGHRADSYVRVTLTETMSMLATIDDNALGSPVGAGDRIVTRLARLLDNVRWKYGLLELWPPAGEPTATLQSTDMAMNRAAECYVAADSTGTIVRSDVTGALVVTTIDQDRPTRLADFSSLFGIPMLGLVGDDDTPTQLWYDADSFVTANNRDAIRNDMRWARVGGTQQVVEHPISIGRFGRRTDRRTDLQCQTDGQVLALAKAAVNLKARTALRVESVSVTSTGRPEAMLRVAAADVHDRVWAFPPTSKLVDLVGSSFGLIRSMDHQVRPLYGRLAWTTTYALDLENILNLPGAMLDPVA